MNKTPRTVTSPKKFVIGRGLLQQMHDYVKDFGDNAFIISDEFILPRVKDEAVTGLQKAGLKGTCEKFNYECTEVEIKRLGALAESQSANVIVGIGGGKTLDSAKAVAYYHKLPVILFPTIASTDAPCTALAVIYSEEGEFERYLFCRKTLMLLLPILQLLQPRQYVSLLPVWVMRLQPILKRVPAMQLTA